MSQSYRQMVGSWCIRNRFVLTNKQQRVAAQLLAIREEQWAPKQQSPFSHDMVNELMWAFYVGVQCESQTGPFDATGRRNNA